MSPDETGRSVGVDLVQPTRGSKRSALDCAGSASSRETALADLERDMYARSSLQPRRTVSNTVIDILNEWFKGVAWIPVTAD
eukprot:1821737-Amphidinium_carterae.1